ncbi:MAG: hypothetical protein RL722_1473 [Pseudomonadota bacterium]|jgi:uncharacterized protein with NRDE domain
MCLAAFALGCHPRFPLVIAANRDEYFHRPTAPMAWWPVAAGGDLDRAILAGRDLSAGGTWMGLSRAGRFALLTNVRTGQTAPAGRPSRGLLVPLWLQGEQPDLPLPGPAEVHAWAEQQGQADYNLILADLAPGHPAGGSTAPAGPAAGTWHALRAGPDGLQALPPAPPGSPAPSGGRIHAVSNGRLDEPWPKLQRLTRALAAGLDDGRATRDSLLARLFEALADDRRADDADLPRTGVPLEAERMLSSVFIRSESGHYGTRCASVLLVEAGRGALVVERSFGPDGQVTGEVRVELPGWPAPGPLPG